METRRILIGCDFTYVAAASTPRAVLPAGRYCLPDVLGDEAWSRFGGRLLESMLVQAEEDAA